MSWPLLKLYTANISGINNKMKTILILRDRISKPMQYVIDHYSLRWKDAGYRVIDHVGLTDIPFADIVIVHIDLTVIPPEYVDYINELPRVINGKILDISSRRFSRLLLSKTDNYTGEVIVKTNANHGGHPEYEILKQKYLPGTPFLSNILLRIFRLSFFKSILKLCFPKILNKRGDGKSVNNWNTVETLNPLAYPIFPDIKSVPPDVWENDHLIVERFINSCKDGLFYMHYYVFFGDKEISGRVGSPNPIVKFGNYVSDEEIPVPDEVRQWRKDLKIDYGRFDYLEAGGKYFLIDVNKTEGGGDTNYEYPDEMDLLSSGLKFYLEC